MAPGQVEWVGESNESIEALADRFESELNRRAAIVGPHGSGKSTLIAHLAHRLGRVIYRQDADGTVVQSDEIPTDAVSSDAIRANEIQAHHRGGNACQTNIIWLQLRKATRPARQIKQSKAYWHKSDLLILDGFEQLGRFHQRRVIFETQVRQMGLLVTSHSEVGLPTLIHTRLDAAKASRIVDLLLKQNENEFDISRARLVELCAAYDGNMREVLMNLYDICNDIGTKRAEDCSQD